MVKIAAEGLNACAGCEIAILNLGEQLSDLLPHLQFVHMPILMDNKYCISGNGKAVGIPKARVGIVSGGVRHSEHLHVLHEMRQQVDILLALGTCAITGGLPALADGLVSPPIPKASKPLPVQGNNPATLPDLHPRCTPLHAHVRVDISIAGCPPHPDWIAEGITALLEDRPPVLPQRAVCSLCPTWRHNKARLPLSPARRMLESVTYDADQDLSHMRCLLEQGFLCLGPITLTGCGGRTGAPKCIAARSPCRGCQGPVNSAGLPLADYAAALTAAGIDAGTIPDKQGYLSRFTPLGRILKQLRMHQAAHS